MGCFIQKEIIMNSYEEMKKNKSWIEILAKYNNEETWKDIIEQYHDYFFSLLEPSIQEISTNVFSTTITLNHYIFDSNISITFNVFTKEWLMATITKDDKVLHIKKNGTLFSQNEVKSNNQKVGWNISRLQNETN